MRLFCSHTAYVVINALQLTLSPYTKSSLYSHRMSKVKPCLKSRRTRIGS